MHRFYLPPEAWDPNALRLSGSEAHHARDVLRLQIGARLVIFNGQGREITAEIVELSRDQILLAKIHEGQTAPLRCRISLAQAMPKGKNMELIVQKAVEIGGAEIFPIISERTIVHLGSAEAKDKQRKWQQVAIEATKQCGQNWLPSVATPQKLRSFFDSAHLFELQLIGSLQADALHFKKVLVHFEIEHGRRPASVLMCIGPEGDFTPAELNLARSYGCHPISLGPIILRVETAALYALSVLSYELLT